MKNSIKSEVDLSNSESVWFDDAGKSPSFFCKNKFVRIDKNTVDQLKKMSVALGNKNVRICLHNNQRDKLHNMINLAYRVEYARPHKHKNKDETYQIIEGMMAIIVFNEEGSVIDKCILDNENNLLYRVGADVYHTAIPVTEIVIFHESRPGPFPREGDSEYPVWAPDGKSTSGDAKYNNELLKNLDILT